MTVDNVCAIIGVENHEYEYEPTVGTDTKASDDA